MNSGRISTWRRWGAGLMAGLLGASTLLLAACGGGSASAPAVTPGPVAIVPPGFYAGTIGGFGSVMVNGVRWDDSSATIQLDDETVAAGSLKLGMQAQVQGKVASDNVSGKADSVTVETAVRGAVTAVDTTASTFRIRDITIATDSKTVFEGASNLAALAVGNWVEVHGTVDFENRRVQATRVEVKPASEMGRVILFGKATGVTPTSFTMNGLTVNYGSARLIGFDSNAIPEGALVRVRSNAAPVGNVLTATVVKAVKAPRFQDGAPAAVEGRVMSFKSAADFMVAGTPVDASNATYENGTAADLAEGKRVIVFGNMKDGKLLATKVRFFRDIDGEIRLIGFITDYVSQSSFKVRGVAVDASAATFEDGTASDLANGRLVELKGSTQGNIVKATEVEFEDSLAQGAVLAGGITDFVSRENFKVNGKSAKISGSARYVGGTEADLKNGAVVWMIGEQQATVFEAKTVIFQASVPALPPTVVAGTVTDAAADGSGFKINGTAVTVAPSTVFTGGTAADLKNGAYVIVTGRVVNGSFAAERIVFADPRREDVCKAFKIEGAVYDFVSTSNFKLLGFTVDASAATFEGGTAADLANGKFVQACGDELPTVSATGATLKAKKIEIKTR
jgi:cytochrome c-type biogenesis protein CcmE